MGTEKTRVFGELDAEVGAVLKRRMMARIVAMRERTRQVPRCD